MSQSPPRALDEADVVADPIVQFDRWFAEALAAGLPMPEAMTLATADAAGRPSARVVLLKSFDATGFTFYTNYQARKSRDIEENPHAALLFFWPPLERQVRIEGTIARVSPAESDAYFQTRPRDSRIGAWASPQSEVIAGRSLLEQRFDRYLDQFGDGPIPCPPHWGGYRVRPDVVELWQGRESRLHDRLRFRREHDRWVVERLAP